MLLTGKGKMELHVFQYFRLSRNAFGQDFSVSHVKLWKTLSFSLFSKTLFFANLCWSHLTDEQFQLKKKKKKFMLETY